ncbi:MAG: hypothetical protein ACRCZF_03300 [Gemmataceae bacterium]
MKALFLHLWRTSRLFQFSLVVLVLSLLLGVTRQPAKTPPSTTSLSGMANQTISQIPIVGPHVPSIPPINPFNTGVNSPIPMPPSVPPQMVQQGQDTAGKAMTAAGKSVDLAGAAVDTLHGWVFGPSAPAPAPAPIAPGKTP